MPTFHQPLCSILRKKGLRTYVLSIATPSGPAKATSVSNQKKPFLTLPSLGHTDIPDMIQGRFEWSFALFLFFSEQEFDRNILCRTLTLDKQVLLADSLPYISPNLWTSLAWGLPCPIIWCFSTDPRYIVHKLDKETFLMGTATYTRSQNLSNSSYVPTVVKNKKGEEVKASKRADMKKQNKFLLHWFSQVKRINSRRIK